MNLGDVQFSQHGGMLVAALSGEVDVSNAETIGEAIADTASNQELGLILDLSALQYLDSAGIRLLFRLRERLRARGQSLSLVIPAGSPSNDALRLAGVTLHIGGYETLDDALEATTVAPPGDPKAVD